MLDCLTPGQSKKDKITKLFKPEVTKEKTITFTTMEETKAGSKIIENVQHPNDKLVITYGLAIPDYVFDCVYIGVSFTAKKEDLLAEQRLQYFGKYFMFSQNHFDLM